VKNGSQIAAIMPENRLHSPLQDHKPPNKTLHVSNALYVNEEDFSFPYP
jgi:hypothetical protein